MIDHTSDKLQLSTEINYFKGQHNDHTCDISLKAIVPLFTPRANLSVWLPIMEWYRHSPQFITSNGVNTNSKNASKGHLTGDVYVTTDIQVLEQHRFRPDLLIRAGMKTASGGGYDIRRYYDCPGYFFDATVGKTLIRQSCFKMRTALQAGFLCWQTDNGRQNDAIMFGARIETSWRKFTLTETFGGYCGWEWMGCKDSEKAHDFPISSRTRLRYDITGLISSYVLFEQGIHDYPYRRFSIGVSFNWSVFTRH